MRQQHKAKPLNTKNGTNIPKMALKNQKWDRMLGLLFEHPEKGFTIREISAKTGIPTSSVQRYLKKLRKEGLASEENRFAPSQHSKFLKAIYIIDRLYECGVVDYLIKTLHPSAIIVFGSARKGEYNSKSDIDLFVESVKSPALNLAPFEKKLRHEIQLFVEKDINNLPAELFNNVINGIKLSGHIKLK